MGETQLYHVFLIKGGEESEILVHTASTYKKALEWVEDYGCTCNIHGKYYFQVTLAFLDSLYLTNESRNKYDPLSIKGNKLELYDVWLVHTENNSSRLEDKIQAKKVSENDANKFIYMGHSDDLLPKRSDYWNYVKVPYGFKPAKYQRR
jgi:hypothetical protein